MVDKNLMMSDLFFRYEVEDTMGTQVYLYVISLTPDCLPRGPSSLDRQHPHRHTDIHSAFYIHTLSLQYIIQLVTGFKMLPLL